MRRWLIPAALGLGLVGLALAGPVRTQAADPDDAAATKEIEDAQKAFEKGQQELLDEYRKLYEEKASKDKIEAVIERYQKFTTDEMPKLFKLAEKAPRSEAAFQVFQLIAAQGSGDREKAREAIEEHHLDKPYIAPFVQSLGFGFDPSAIELLEKIRSVNSDRKVLATAAFGLGMLHKRLIKTDSEKQSEHVEKAKSLLAEVSEKYSDVELAPGQTLAELASSQAESIDTLLALSVGKEILDLEGEDTDGTRFKLSDYRGKVVLIDFWAFW